MSDNLSREGREAGYGNAEPALLYVRYTNRETTIIEGVPLRDYVRSLEKEGYGCYTKERDYWLRPYEYGQRSIMEEYPNGPNMRFITVRRHPEARPIAAVEYFNPGNLEHQVVYAGWVSVSRQRGGGNHD